MFKPERTVKAKTTDFDRRNIETARIILASPDQHGGADAFPAVWARAVLKRLNQEYTLA
jgi:hypothetical protein